MSTAFYAGLAKVTLRLMKAKGQTMYLIRRTPAAYDPATSSAAAPGEAREQCYGIEFALPATEQPDQSVPSLSKGIYLEAINPTADPQTYDALEISGVVHEIVTSKPLSPAGLAVLYELRVKLGG